MCYAEVDPCFRALTGPHPVTGQRRPLASTVSVSWRKWYNCATATRPSWLPTEPTSTLTLSTCVCKTSGYVRSLFVNLDVRILGILLKGVGGKHLCTEVKQPHIVEFCFWQIVNDGVCKDAILHSFCSCADVTFCQAYPRPNCAYLRKKYMVTFCQAYPRPNCAYLRKKYMVTF